MLKLVGVTLGGDLRGPVLARYALVEAADEYRVIFSLTELDKEVTERAVLLADRPATASRSTRRKGRCGS